MSMYVEGTKGGLIKIRDIQKEGELVMHLPTEFKNDTSIKVLGYDSLKNILFASCKDGSFRLWKVHHEWRSKNVEN